MAKDSTIFYQGQVDICRRHFSAEQFGRLMSALFDFASGGDPEVGDDIVIAFEFMALQQGIDKAKYERICEKNRLNAKKGGAPKGNQNARKTTQNNRSVEKQPNAKKNNPNENENDNDNDDENDNENESGLNPDDSARSAILSSSLCSYLNQKTGGSHQPTSDMQVMVAVLLSQGYTEADMRAVIDKKTEEWLDVPKMRQYLRPSTLFGKKFEQYLAEPESSGTQQRKKKSKRAAAVREDLDGARDELDSVLSLMERIRGRPGGIESEEYRELADQRMVLEQRVEQLSKQLERLEER